MSSNMHLQGAISTVPSHSSDISENAIFDLLHNVKHDHDHDHGQKHKHEHDHEHEHGRTMERDHNGTMSEQPAAALTLDSESTVRSSPPGSTNGNLHLNLKEMASQDFSQSAFNTDMNHFQLSPKLKMNPRDAASPRRSRMVTKRQHYDTASAANAAANGNGNGNMSTSYSQMDAGSVSLQSHKTESTTHSASVGGLQYVEGMSMSLSSTPSKRSTTTNQNQSQKSAGTHGQLRTGPATPRAYEQFPNPTWPQAYQQSNSVSSKSTHAKSSSSKISKKQGKRNLHLGEEQILFEQRLCDADYGVAVRKIHSNGKSQLRYVKCIPYGHKRGRGSKKQHDMSLSVPDSKMNYYSSSNHHHHHHHHRKNYSSSKSVTSLMGRISLASKRSKSKASASASASVSASLSGTLNENATVNTSEEMHSRIMTEKQLQKQGMALTWGNKKKVIIPLCSFVAIQKGKTTGRTVRNPCPPSRLLSLVTNDKRHGHGSLDIEAPTRLDRDKFAMAFSIFLDIPLKDDFVGEDVKIGQEDIPDDLFSLPSVSTSTASSVMTPHGLVEYQIGGSLLPSLNSSPVSRDESSKLIMESDDIASGLGIGNDNHSKKSQDSLNELLPPAVKRTQGLQGEIENGDADAIKPIPDAKKEDKDDKDDQSAMSSLTQGFDQEVVEELHQALNELRAELDISRAEAARAVKVAEQAIQSAESCSSNDWNSTVTHKAAEAAAQAQKRSAEAIAKHRHAEEKLVAERKSASFWRKQAQCVEEQASALQTRLAVAQVQRAAVTDELDREKRKAASYIQNLKRDYSMQESIQRESLVSGAEQNRLLETELDGTRRDLIGKSEEAKALLDSLTELKSEITTAGKNGNKKKFFGKAKKSRGPLLLDSRMNSTTDECAQPKSTNFGSIHTEELLKIQAEASAMRTHFKILRRTTVDELGQLPEQAQEWADRATKAVDVAQSEVALLKNQIALEMSSRRKLLHEVQDLRGTVRVYCRPRTPINNVGSTGIISAPSREIGLLHREEVVHSKGIGAVPMCFEFDQMFPTNASQSEVYAEMEEIVLGSLEGFNACLMAYGQTGSGKTYSMLGNIEITKGDGFGNDAMPIVNFVNHGIHLLAVRQIFQVSSGRKDRFEDSFSLSILEIHDEKLIDLVAGTNIAESSGIIKGVDRRDRRVSKIKDEREDSSVSDDGSRKLEIRTNHEGDTIVQGQITVPINSFEDALKVWKQSLSLRASKNTDIDLKDRDSSSHVIATIEIMSTNVTTGIGTVGKLQFGDLACSDVTQKRGSSSTSRSNSTGIDSILAPLGNNSEWKFKNKSLSTLVDVVDARVNFSRNPPYRNSTLTHVLRDALEADTKTVLLVCAKSDPEDIQNTANSLRFASKMKKVVIGKATKRHITMA